MTQPWISFSKLWPTFTSTCRNKAPLSTCLHSFTAPPVWVSVWCFSLCLQSSYQPSWDSHGGMYTAFWVTSITKKKNCAVNARSHNKLPDLAFILLHSPLCVWSQVLADYWPAGGDTLPWHPPSVCHLCLPACLSYVPHDPTAQRSGLAVSMSMFFVLPLVSMATVKVRQKKTNRGRLAEMI